MKKINIENFKYKAYISDVLYIIEIINNNYYIKRIKNKNSIKNIEIIEIIDNLVNVKSFIYYNKYKIENILGIFEKDEVIKEIFLVLKNINIVNEVLDIDKLMTLFNNNYVDYLISNGNIALSLNTNNVLNVVLLETNCVIGKIIIDTVDIFVDDYYFEETLNLFKNYLCLFKKDNILKKILNK